MIKIYIATNTSIIARMVIPLKTTFTIDNANSAIEAEYMRFLRVFLRIVFAMLLVRYRDTIRVFKCYYNLLYV